MSPALPNPVRLLKIPSRLVKTIASEPACALAIGGAVVAAVGSVWAPRRWSTAFDPCGPSGFDLPDGDATVVVTDDGAELAVTIAGPPASPGAPTVVLAHGWTLQRGVWGAVARRLVLGGHRVVLYDHRGHGRSTLGTAPLTIERLGADLRAVLEQLDITEAVLVGHSMGGMTLQSFATAYPDDLVARTKAIVLVSTAARFLGHSVPSVVVEGVLGDRRVQRFLRGSIGLALARPAVGRRPRIAHVMAVRDGLVTTPSAARVGFLVAMSGMDLRPGLGKIPLPTTVLVGTQDRLTPPRFAQKLAKAIPCAELIVLPGAGHMLPLEEPDRLVDAICAAASVNPAPEKETSAR